MSLQLYRDYVEPPSALHSTHLNLTLLPPAGPHLHLVGGEVVITAKLSGVRWWMYEWYLTSALVGVLTLWGLQMVLGVGVGLLVWTKGGWWQPGEGEEGEGEGEGGEGKLVGEELGGEFTFAPAPGGRGKVVQAVREGEPGAPGEGGEVDEYKLTGEDVVDALDRAFPTLTPTTLRHRPV